MPCENCSCKGCNEGTKLAPDLKVYSYSNLIGKIDLDRNCMILYISGRNSGKSFSIQNLVYEMMKHKDYDAIYCFSETARLSSVDTSYGFVPKEFIFRNNEILQVMEQIIYVQKLRAEQKKAALSILVIFDDIEIEKNSGLDALAVRGRHFGLTVILSSQKASTLISSTIRSNFDYLFWREINETDVKDYIQPMLTKTNYNKKETEILTKDNLDSDYNFIFYNNVGKRKDGGNILHVLAKKVKFTFKIKSFTAKAIKQNHE